MFGRLEPVKRFLWVASSEILSDHVWVKGFIHIISVIPFVLRDFNDFLRSRRFCWIVCKKILKLKWIQDNSCLCFFKIRFLYPQLFYGYFFLSDCVFLLNDRILSEYLCKHLFLWDWFSAKDLSLQIPAFAVLVSYFNLTSDMGIGVVVFCRISVISWGLMNAVCRLVSKYVFNSYLGLLLLVRLFNSFNFTLLVLSVELNKKFTFLLSSSPKASGNLLQIFFSNFFLDEYSFYFWSRGILIWLWL